MAEPADPGLNMPIPGLAPSTPASVDRRVSGLPMPTPRLGEEQAGRLILRCLEGDAPGVVYQLPDPGGLVGRKDAHEAIEPECDLTDQESGKTERSVSRRHAEFSRRGEQFVVIDLGSINGTTVNGTRLAPGRPMPVDVGDVIAFGRVSLVIGSLGE